MSFPDLSARQRDLLFVVAGIGPASGQDVKTELRESQEIDLLPGVLYSNLDELVDAGLVSKSKADGRTNQYAVTDAGRRTLADLLSWQRRYQPTAEH